VDLFEYQASQLARAAADVAGYLLGLKVDLTKSAVLVDGTAVKADFLAAIADYAGYAQGVVTWGTPSVSDDGFVEVIGNVPEFRPSGSGTPNDVWDAFFTEAVGAALLFCGQFDGPPLPMHGTTDAIQMVVRYRPADTSLVVQIS
jgi:hypothetical protein